MIMILYFLAGQVLYEVNVPINYYLVLIEQQVAP